MDISLALQRLLAEGKVKPRHSGGPVLPASARLVRLQDARAFRAADSGRNIYKQIDRPVNKRCERMKRRYELLKLRAKTR
jgi:hypothetical protein